MIAKSMKELFPWYPFPHTPARQCGPYLGTSSHGSVWLQLRLTPGWDQHAAPALCCSTRAPGGAEVGQSQRLPVEPSAVPWVCAVRRDVGLDRVAATVIVDADTTTSTIYLLGETLLLIYTSSTNNILLRVIHHCVQNFRF